MESHKNIDSQFCANGCDFYGSIKNHNLCPKCFKEQHQKAAAIAESIEEPLNPSSPPPNSPFTLTNSMPRFSFSLNPNTNNTISDSNSNSLFASSSSSSNKHLSFSGDSSLTFKTLISLRNCVNNFSFGSSTTKKNRCNRCNKRVGLTGFECRCGNLFCGKHRYPEEHACSFDFKAFGRELLLKQNPICKADKLQRLI